MEAVRPAKVEEVVETAEASKISEKPKMNSLDATQAEDECPPQTGATPGTRSTDTSRKIPSTPGTPGLTEDIGNVKLISKKRQTSQNKQEIYQKAKEIARQKMVDECVAAPRKKPSDDDVLDDTLHDITSLRHEDEMSFKKNKTLAPTRTESSGNATVKPPADVVHLTLKTETTARNAKA
ncbi:unnamed protein product [Caenorhabditis bovis]|uniref:Uncharacterized protein n=1 Tax=Caenorhabditis bovis TaxID=2654633 RepID=A0A8S1EG21_9PELO|nr:unnamed protein product [Caenorhabditis bovis]